MSRDRGLKAYEGPSYPYQRGEETGTVFCPMKLAGIAVMRCWEYQKQAVGSTICPCPSRATRGQIAALEETLKVREEDPQTCPHCGGWKSYYAHSCIKCRGASPGARRPYRRKEQVERV